MLAYNAEAFRAAYPVSQDMTRFGVVFDDGD
jgi:hypothetical protein